MHLFINEDTDPAAIADVIHNGQIRIAIICLPYFLDGLMEVFASMLRGMGSAIAPTLITVVGICGVRILWILTIFAVDHVLDILYLSYPVSWFLTAGDAVCLLSLRTQKADAHRLRRSGSRLNGRGAGKRHRPHSIAVGAMVVFLLAFVMGTFLPW